MVGFSAQKRADRVGPHSKWAGVRAGFGNTNREGGVKPPLHNKKRQMKRCWAYQAIAGSRMAWVPCARMAEEGSRFCARHARAIEGAVLGALIHAEARNEAVTLYEDLRPWNLRGRKRRVRHRTVTVDERVAEVTACVDRRVFNTPTGSGQTPDTESGARSSQRRESAEKRTDR